MTEISFCFHSPLLCLSCPSLRIQNTPQNKTNKKPIKQKPTKQPPNNLPHCSLNLARNEVKGNTGGYVAAYKCQSSPTIQIWTSPGTSAPCCPVMSYSSRSNLLVQLLNSFQGQYCYRVEESKNKTKPKNSTKPTNDNKPTNKPTNKKPHFHPSLSVLSPEISVCSNQLLKGVQAKWVDQESENFMACSILQLPSVINYHSDLNFTAFSF